ncbi:hypothetical protein VPHK479_0048 [Vibrio phage K479]
MQDLLKNDKWRGMAMKRDKYVARGPRTDAEENRLKRAAKELKSS